MMPGEEIICSWGTMPSWREDERLHDLNDLVFFAAVVEHSGFSAAARSLNLPKSSVSRHVGRLEDRLGVHLLERSTRNVRLTEIGSSYYAGARRSSRNLRQPNRTSPY